MQDLALAGGKFEIALPAVEGGASYGLENVEFLVAANPNQPLRPLAKVASGGELSRIGLAVQVITSRSAAVPTLIFDEVDVGIGGGVAEVVGRLLRTLGKDRQVLCVTHLPQVAAQAAWQWSIAKKQRRHRGVVARNATRRSGADRGDCAHAGRCEDHRHDTPARPGDARAVRLILLRSGTRYGSVGAA